MLEPRKRVNRRLKLAKEVRHIRSECPFVDVSLIENEQMESLEELRNGSVIQMAQQPSMRNVVRLGAQYSEVFTDLHSLDSPNASIAMQPDCPNGDYPVGPLPSAVAAPE
jgi:hypothetical protein